MLRLRVHLGLSHIVRARPDRDGRVRGKRRRKSRESIGKRERQCARPQKPPRSQAAAHAPLTFQELPDVQQKTFPLTSP